jgi:glutamate synthase (NADPH/NADH) small chain
MARLNTATSAHDAGGERRFATETLEFHGEESLREIVLRHNHSSEVTRAPADLVLIAAGFVGPELDVLGLNSAEFVTPRATLSVTPQWRLEALEGTTPVFACGDAVRGQSLIVWAIAEGRSAASAVDSYLSGAPSALPAPVEPYSVSW